jgi:PAS domain S-box-containing protein
VALAVDDALNFDASQHAKEALRASEESFRLIVDSIPGLVCTMTATGEFQLFNRQLLEYFGKTPEEIKKWATSDVVHPDDLPRVIAAFTSSIKTGQPYDIEHRCRRTDGMYRWTQRRAPPVRDTEGRFINWSILFTDIDARKQAEERLQLLLDGTNQVVSNLKLRDLLRAISASVRQVMRCDCASLALPHEENKQLQLYVLDFPEGKGFLHEEGLYSMEGSPYGTTFRTMKPFALSYEQTIRSRGVCAPALKPRGEWEGSRTKCQGFKPDLGNSAVRHYRGAFKNVARVEMRPNSQSKERAW